MVEAGVGDWRHKPQLPVSASEKVLNGVIYHGGSRERPPYRLAGSRDCIICKNTALILQMKFNGSGGLVRFHYVRL